MLEKGRFPTRIGSSERCPRLARATTAARDNHHPRLRLRLLLPLWLWLRLRLRGACDGGCACGAGGRDDGCACNGRPRR
ncbi:hypothetical protein ACIHAR_03595 [Streptomyces sp. NPDC052016]|uniref:hypothetical protein n=1 Tax=Streptomyces sp. NPDC052016 TaxID=3365680 RepID=UPI0037D4777A